MTNWLSNRESIRLFFLQIKLIREDVEIVLSLI